jgi:hypothetical protein
MGTNGTRRDALFGWLCFVDYGTARARFVSWPPILRTGEACACSVIKIGARAAWLTGIPSGSVGGILPGRCSTYEGSSLSPFVSSRRQSRTARVSRYFVAVAEQRFRMPDRVPVIVRDVEQLDRDGMEVCAISRHHRLRALTPAFNTASTTRRPCLATGK